MLFPFFTEVDILMNIKWTNQEYREIISDQPFTFQHAIYTLSFEPTENELYTEIISSHEENKVVIRG